MEQRTKVLLAFVLFAWPCFAQSYVPPIDPAATCGPNEVSFQLKADPQAPHLPTAECGEAAVYIVETQKVYDVGNITVKIALDGAWVGANQGDCYFFVTVKSGEHHLCARWQSSLASWQEVSLNNLTAESGKIYYF